MTLEIVLEEVLAQRFADSLMRLAEVPPARRQDVEDAPRFSSTDGEISCICGITGATYTESWDGSRDAAETFAEYVGEATAGLVRKTKKHHHYAWLYSTR